MDIVRNPAVSGLFYPDDSRQLRLDVVSYLDEHKLENFHPKALIVPHAGYIYSGSIAAHAYKQLQPFREAIRKVVLLGPSHRVAFRGLALPECDYFRTPLGKIQVDQHNIRLLANQADVIKADRAHAQEHSLEVHLPFLQILLKEFTLTPIVVGDTKPEVVANVLQHVWGGEETLIVVSSDLSHFLAYDDAKSADSDTCHAIENMNFSKLDYDSACGRMPVSGLLHLAKQKQMKIHTIDLRNSGDTAGTRDRVVGYGAWILEENHDPL